MLSLLAGPTKMEHTLSCSWHISAPSLQPSFTSSPASTKLGLKKLEPSGPFAHEPKPECMQHTLGLGRIASPQVTSGKISAGAAGYVCARLQIHCNRPWNGQVEACHRYVCMCVWTEAAGRTGGAANTSPVYMNKCLVAMDTTTFFFPFLEAETFCKALENNFLAFRSRLFT